MFWNKKKPEPDNVACIVNKFDSDGFTYMRVHCYTNGGILYDYWDSLAFDYLDTLPGKKTETPEQLAEVVRLMTLDKKIDQLQRTVELEQAKIDRAEKVRIAERMVVILREQLDKLTANPSTD